MNSSAIVVNPSTSLVKDATLALPSSSLPETELVVVFDRNGRHTHTDCSSRLCRKTQRFLGRVQRRAGYFGIRLVRVKHGEMVVFVREGMRPRGASEFIMAELKAVFD